jgi:hypothetical protein
MRLVEEKPPARGPFRKLLIILGADTLIFLVFMIFFKPTPDKSAVEIFLLWGVFITNLCLAVATRYIKKELYGVFLINSLCACLIFHLMFYEWILVTK